MKKGQKLDLRSLVESPGHPDGRRFSPVVRADSKFYGPAICVDVRFKNVAQLDDFIAALVELRAFPKDGFDHVHLQDTGRGIGSAEVTFYHPSVKRNAIDRSCVREARKSLEAFLPET
jgi:hypothetical protein